MTTATTEYPYRLWYHNGQPLARSVEAALDWYERVYGVRPNALLAPARDAARIQEVTTLTVQPDRACLPGHIMVAYREVAAGG